MTPTEQDNELRECFSCKKQKIVNEHWLCSECKSEIRTIDDTWLVQEFRKWHSDDEVAEAINQIKQTILFENDTLITADRKRVALEARIAALDTIHKRLASSDLNTKHYKIISKMLIESKEGYREAMKQEPEKL